MMRVSIRRATVDDAEPIAAVLNEVIAEGRLTVFDRPFSADDERRFLSTLGPRSALHVADADGAILGVQSIDLFSDLGLSVSHVATMGTWLRREMRGRGMGRLLAAVSIPFALANGYSKIVVQVLATNDRALRFYRRLGFADIGVARKHVLLCGVFHDEIYLEMLLDSSQPAAGVR
jgi:RimJ/RimL family protein N-acetyltransferase